MLLARCQAKHRVKLQYLQCLETAIATEQAHVDLMGNTAMSTIPPKVQVGFFCMILWAMFSSVRSLEERHCTGRYYRSFVAGFAMFKQKWSMFLNALRSFKMSYKGQYFEHCKKL